MVITSDPAPVTLVTRVPGRITLLKRDEEKCEAGEVIGYIQSNANVADVLELESWLPKDSLPNRTLELGDLRCYDFRQNLRDGRFCGEIRGCPEHSHALFGEGEGWITRASPT